MSISSMSSKEVMLLSSGDDILKSEIWKHSLCDFDAKNNVCILPKAETTMSK